MLWLVHFLIDRAVWLTLEALNAFVAVLAERDIVNGSAAMLLYQSTPRQAA